MQIEELVYIFYNEPKKGNYINAHGCTCSISLEYIWTEKLKMPI